MNADREASGGGLPKKDAQAMKAFDFARSAWKESPREGDYWEDFSGNPCGWIANSREQLIVDPEGAVCRGPWALDANHAPPGAGYLHLLMHIHTLEERLHAPYARQAGMYSDAFIRERRHAFVHGGHSRNLTNVRVRVRIRGEAALRGSQCTILAQGQPGLRGPRANWILTGQHYEITPEWSDQELLLTPDPSQWTFLGSRHDLTDLYGHAPIERVLEDVNVSLIFVLFPVVVEPESPVPDKHLAWADKDYFARRDLLPTGFVRFRYVWFRYPPNPASPAQ